MNKVLCIKQTRLDNKALFPGEVYDLSDRIDISNAIRNGIVKLIEEEVKEEVKISQEDIDNASVDTGPEGFDFIDEKETKGKVKK